MKAMILAAGSGTRLQPLTLSTPKPMIRLGTTPVMETQIRHLAAAGIREIVVNTSYLSHEIETYFGNGEAWGVDIAYSYEGKIQDQELVAKALGSGGGIRRIQDHSGFFDEPFLVLCGDAFVNFDVAAFKREHDQRHAMASILTQSVSPAVVHKYGVVVTDDTGLVTSFQEKPEREAARSLDANTGIYLFSPEVINHIPKDSFYDIGSELFPGMVEKNLPLYAQTQRFDWLDVGCVADLFAANAHLLDIPTAGFALPGRELKPGLWVGGNCAIDVDTVDCKGTVVIEGGCRIEPGVSLVGPMVVQRGCIVESGAQLREAYIGPYMRVSKGQPIERLIVHREFAINADGNHTLWRDTYPELSDARGTREPVLTDVSRSAQSQRQA